MEYRISFGGVRVYNGMAWADFDGDGNLIRQNPQMPGFICGTLTTDQLAEASETIKKFSEAPFSGNIYLRFGELPKGGKSRNYASGNLELGVSCYGLSWDLISSCYKISGSGLDGAMILYIMQGAPIYFISGEECGIGSDGEPVLRDVKILANAKFDKEKGGYVVKNE